MTDFLLTWAPGHWPDEELRAVVRECLATGYAVEPWRIAAYKMVKPGDRVWLLKQGKKPNAIFAIGEVTSDSYLADAPESRSGAAHYVDVKFSRFVNPNFTWIIPDEVVRPILGDKMGVRGSGVSLDAGTAEALRRAFVDCAFKETVVESPTNSGPVSDAEGGSAAPDTGRSEGTVTERLCKSRKRDAALRRQKLDEAKAANGGRLVCEVPGCGFDYEERYGELGRDFAIIHHKVPLASRPDDGNLTRMEDLAIVCSNCHDMIHVGGECRDLNVLQINAREGAATI